MLNFLHLVITPPESSVPIAMRENTAKLNPTPSALHLMASGVVNQIRITDTNASGSDIPYSSTGDKNKKATEVFRGLWENC